MMTLQIRGGVVTLDDNDYFRVNQEIYQWYENHGYAVCWLPESKSFVRMHQLILDYYGPDDIDHKNRNRLDNRKENLRIVPHFINLHNTKLRTDNTNGHKGLFLNRSGSYGFQVWIKGKKHSKQGYKTKDEASVARSQFLELKLKELGFEI